MRAPMLYAAALLAGLAITLVLASWLTPRAWWRRPTAGNLFIAGAGAWAFGSLLWHVAGAAPPFIAFPASPAMAQQGLPRVFGLAGGAGQRRELDNDADRASLSGSATRRAASAHGADAESADAPRAFRVHRDLNLRAAAGVGSPRLALVPAGASVVPTGLRSGDWWQVRTQDGGGDETGWVNSLWLRRAGE